ncbi:MAG: azurin [Flavisolibacter sp.]|nr:azurin [Flavisolibacter sp.]
MKKIFIAVTVAASFFVIACNGGNKSQEEPQTTEAGKDTATSTPSSASNVVEITANDQLKFDKIEIHVKANEPVSLTLKNIGTMPKESMGHNFVLLKDGTDLAAFATSAISAPEHIPANNSAIVAHTKLLGPGESDTIEFTVPAGTYTYICSFPGHYMSMTGVLIAE